MAYYPFATEFNARYVLTGPDGSVAVFNDPTDTSYVGVLTEVTGLDSAEVRESSADLTESDGGVHGNFYFSRRPVVLNGMVTGHASNSERATRLDMARRATMSLRGDSTLSWKPSKRVENILANPSPQTAATYWSSSAYLGATITGAAARVAGDGASGTTGAIETTATTVAGSQVQIYNGAVTSPPRIARVNPGQVPGVSMSFKHVSGPAGTYSVQIGYYNAAGTYINQYSVGSLVNPATGVWNTISGKAPSAAPAGAYYAYIALVYYPTTSGTVVMRADDAFIDPSGSTLYVDGESAGYYWQGDRYLTQTGDFVEMFTTLRRQQPWRESGQWNKTFQAAMVSQYATLFGTQVKTVAAGVAAENRGNYPAYPLLNLTGTSTNPTLSDGIRTFTTTGLTIASGETLQIDTLNHTATFTAGARNGQTGNRYINFATTAWPYLAGSGTTQTFTLTGGGSATVQFRDTWA